MPKIEIIEFHRPNRRREVHQVERTEPICQMVSDLKRKGFAIEIENNGGVIWASVVNHSDPDGPLAADDIGPAKGFLDRLNRLIEKAHERYVP